MPRLYAYVSPTSLVIARLSLAYGRVYTRDVSISARSVTYLEGGDRGGRILWWQNFEMIGEKARILRAKNTVRSNL